MSSAAAQEIRMVLPSWQIFLMAIVSPLVEGPIIARTFSSSISCLAREIAFSGLPPESFMSSSILWPLTPPSLFIFSTSISAVFASGIPRFDAPPVIAKIAPTLTGDTSAAFSTPETPTAHTKTRIPVIFARCFLIITFFFYIKTFSY